MHEVQKNAEKYGVMVEGVRIDLDKMMAQKDKAVTGLTKGVEGLFKKYKVQSFTLEFRQIRSHSHIAWRPRCLLLLQMHVC